MDFKPVDYDRDTIPPDAPAGTWEASCSVKKKTTAKDQYPMLILNFKLEDTEEEDNKHALGSEVADFLVFFPDGAKGSKQAKLRLRKVCEAFKVDLSILPTGRIGSWDDLQDFIDAIDKQRCVIYTTVKTDPESGESRTNVFYTQPGGSFAAPDEEEDEAPARGAKGKTASKAAPAKGKTTARR